MWKNTLQKIGKQRRKNSNLTNQNHHKSYSIRAINKTQEVTTILTVLLAIATFWMAWETHRLVNENKVSISYALQTAEAANKSATVSQKNVVIMDSTMMVANRAYLVIDGVSLMGVGSNQPYEFDISVKNVGKTPAYNVHISRIKMSFRKAFTNKNEVGKIIIDKTKSVIIGAGIPYTLKSLSEQKAPKKGLLDNGFFFLGRVTYKDIFGILHYTQFSGWHEMSLGETMYNAQGNLNKAN